MSVAALSLFVTAVIVLVALLTNYFAQRESQRAGVEVARDLDDLWGEYAAQLEQERRAEEGERRNSREKEPSRSEEEVTGETLRPVAREVALMSKYHAQGLAQSRISFIFSIGFAALGFLVIAVAILTTDPDKAITDQAVPFAAVVSSIVIEAVASLFFVQSNRAQQVMVEFFDRLRTDRRLEEALQLADQMPDPTLRARMMLVLGLSLAERQVTDELLSVLIGVAEADRMGDRRGVIDNKEPDST